MWRWAKLYAAVLLSVIFTVSPILAELATDVEMRQVAENWTTEIVAKTGGWAGVTDPSVVSQGEIRSEGGELLARYYNLDPRGYVVVPVLKEMTPVKMYSDESNLGPEQEEGVIQLLREVLSARVEAYRQVYGSTTVSQPGGDGLFDQSQKQAWTRLAIPTRDFRVSSSLSIEAEAGPLTTTVWHQGAPYNNDCPMGDGSRVVVGCVATAAAQIMAYWQWPESGFGSHSYFWEGDDCNGGTAVPEWLSADFSDGYDWANILDTYGSGYTPEQAAAVANLNSEVGIAVSMNYGACASGAQMEHRIWNDYFKYSPEVWREDRVQHTQQSWFDLIVQEIDAGRLIWYTINSHAIVCDGYRDDGGGLEYHMNYGWGGSQNAWFVLDNLYCYWIEGDVCPWEQDYMFGNIEPQYDPALALIGFRTVEAAGSDGDGHADPGETVHLSFRIKNRGNDATLPTGILMSGDPFVTVDPTPVSFGPEMTWGAEATSLVEFVVTIDPGCPDPYLADFTLTMSADPSYETHDDFRLYIGDTPGLATDFETTFDGWENYSNTNGFTNDWHLETYRSHSGSSSFMQGGPGGANHSNQADGVLVTPPLLIPPDGDLSFWHWIEAEDDANNTAWDGATVEISTGEFLGEVWTQLTPASGYPYTIIDNEASPFAAGTPCFSGSNGWAEESVDLAGYAGEVARIRFRFGSDAAVTMEGWYVDDVMVCNTDVGSAVSVLPSSDVVVTFAEVTSPGQTLVAPNAGGPVMPPGWVPVPLSDPIGIDLTSTATITGLIHVGVAYDEASLTMPEAGLCLLHYNGAEWVDVTSSRAPEHDLIYGEVSSLSPFALAVPVEVGCCVGLVGNANGSEDEEPTIGDISTIVDAKFISQSCDGLIDCFLEADVNLSGGSNPTCDDLSIGDVSTLVDYLFISGPESYGPLPNCL